jgi:uncharacterized NAD(P)/FAD-binding protein YdhS
MDRHNKSIKIIDYMLLWLRIALPEVSVSEFFDVAIIGGGYTGATLALHLVRLAPADIRIVIVEPRAELGSGLAYETLAEEHRINVPAERMGVGAGRPDRFDIWLKTYHSELIGDGASESTYVARRWFGTFVRDRLHDALTRSRVVLHHVRARATSARLVEGGTEISLSSGALLCARHTIVAVSHGLPILPDGMPASLQGKRELIDNPWDLARLSEISPDSPVLIIGTGLTMADVVASLLARHHSGAITAISRHGLLARKAGPADVPPGLEFAKWPEASLRTYVRQLRAEIVRAEASGFSWRGIFTALREQSAHLWARLSQADKRRFLRHLKAFYDVHRYRMAPETYGAVETAQARGQVEILAARLIAARASAHGFDVILRRRGASAKEQRHYAAIVNCTGPRQRLRADRSDFLGALIEQDLAQPDSLDLGLAVDANFQLVGKSRNLYALGPLTRERFGDTYGAPEIQRDAERLARLLAATLADEKAAAA